MDAQQTRNILEACLLVAGRAMSVAQLEALFESDIDRPDRKEIKLQLEELQKTYEGRGIELIEVASGWRLQSRSSMEHWVSRLFTEKSPRYSRALLETLVLIAYRQPITRGEIEEIRGVAVSSNIVRTLQEREWVKEVGHKEVPGRPALLGTTRQFLDYFNLKRLDELPPLSEIKDLEEIDATLAAEMGVAGLGVAGESEAGAGEAGLEADGSGVAGPSEADVGEADVGEANADDVGDTENEIAEINIEGAGGHGVDESDQGPVNETANDVSDSSEDQGDADSATAGDAQTGVDVDVDISLKSDAEETLADTDTEDDSSEDDSSDDNTIESELLSEDEAVEEADGDDVDSETSDALDDEGSDETPDADSTDTEAGSDPENDALGELDPQTELRRVISEFADEHQRELDVQKDLDSRNLTTVDDSPDDDNIGADDASDSDTESSAVKNKALAVELVGEHDVMSLNQNPDLEPADDVVSDASSDAIADTASATEPEP